MSGQSATDARRKAAMEVVLQEEAERGHQAQPLASVSVEKQHGCDRATTGAAAGGVSALE